MTTVYIFERWSVEDSAEQNATGWVPRTSYSTSMSIAMDRMRRILNEQFPAVPDRLLFVEVGGNRSAAVEVKPDPVGVKFTEVW